MELQEMIEAMYQAAFKIDANRRVLAYNLPANTRFRVIRDLIHTSSLINAVADSLSYSDEADEAPKPPKKSLEEIIAALDRIRESIDLDKAEEAKARLDKEDPGEDPDEDENEDQDHAEPEQAFEFANSLMMAIGDMDMEKPNRKEIDSALGLAATVTDLLKTARKRTAKEKKEK